MWNDKVYFSEPKFDALLVRTEKIAALLPESWSFWFSRQGFQTILFTFDFPGTPEVDPYGKYLSDHYDVSMTASPGSVKCGSIAEANYFLDLVEKRAKWKTPKVYYEKVLKAATYIHRMAYDDQAYKYTERGGAESLPCRGVEVPYWMEQHGWKADADLILTVDWSDIYCHRGDIPAPGEEYEGSFLIGHEGESGGEAEVQLHNGDDAYFKQIYGFAMGSLEEFLLCQLLCWRGYGADGRGDDRSQCKPEYAYIRYDMVAGIWFRPTANNVQYFDKAIKTSTFKGYYNEYESHTYDASGDRVYGPSEREQAVWAWLIAARKDAIDLEDDDARNHVDYLRVEWHEPTVDEVARVAHDGWIEWLSAEAA